MATAPVYRTVLEPMILDLLDFIEEKLSEALEDPSSPFAAVIEAGCAMPIIRERLREDEVIAAHFALALDAQLDRDHSRKWWDHFARMPHADFARKTSDIMDRVRGLRDILRPGPRAV
jgi:hypothetical protein